MRNHREQGIALITTLLVLILLSTMIAGIAWMVISDQKLGGNNADRQLAFYGAEAGMESLTASLENLFDANYAPNATAINGLMTNPGPPSNIPNVQYIAPGLTTPGSGYQIMFTPSSTNANLPATSWGTIPTGTYAGLVGLMTPYTLQVTARTTSGSEVRLQREVQTVGIPVFQFGFFSQMDLSFFAGPNFNFGGRVHSNGNLWLNEGDGSTLTMTQKVTAAGEIITSNLENGWPGTTAGTYGGTVNITNGSGVSNLLVQNPPQSVTGTNNYYGNIGAYNTAFKPMANSVYNNNIGVAQTGVQPLNLSIATPAIGGQPIDLIRRPQPGEATNNLAKLQERYWSQVSLRILLSGYGPSGTCADSDISSTNANPLPYISANGTGNSPTPVDLATLAWDISAPHTSGNLYPPYYQPPNGFTTNATYNNAIGKTIFPLPVSYAQGATYNSGANPDGYWVAEWYPTVTGCLKIDYQANTSTLTTPVWNDVTWEILGLGYTGRNINPQTGNPKVNGNNTGVPTFVAPPKEPGNGSPYGSSQTPASGPTAFAGVVTVGCQDPSPNAVIRLARLRDNPSTASGGNNATNGNDWCGNNNGKTVGTWSNLPTKTSVCSTGSGYPTDTINCPSTHGYDYWPNVLFDTREGVLQDNALTNNVLTTGGAMQYIELDIKNLALWFTGTIGSSGTNVLATNGYSVYFSDRRNERPDPSPPASVSAASALTGGFGYEDIQNNYGCPNGAVDPGEDLESDYVNGVSQQPNYLRTYGNILNPLPTSLWTIALNGTPSGTQLGSVAALIPSILTTNPACTGTGTNWPYAAAKNGVDLRENPPIFFRHALKIVDGDTISLGTCNSVPCGLTAISENPVYVQSCFNNPGECGMTTVSWSATSVGTSFVADALTLLSDNWNDVNSFQSPYDPSSRNSAGNSLYGATNGNTTYRMAVAAGKGIPFQQPTNGGPPKDFGTDGGAHNFLRYLEDWSGTLYYEGSIVSMYYNHQAVGIYKCCNTVYSPPTRGYQFDTNFLTPSLLPPLTPMLRTVNTVGFTQMLLPTQ